MQVNGAQPSSGPVRRCIVHIIDTDPHSLSANGWLEDVSKVQKYEMSEADYEQRENTYRKFKEQKLKVSRCAASLSAGRCSCSGILSARQTMPSHKCATWLRPGRNKAMNSKEIAYSLV